MVTETRGCTHSLEHINKGIVATVAFGGSTMRASASLKDQGVVIASSTLDLWKRKFADEYNRLRIEHGDELEQVAILEMRETIMAAGEAERLAIEKAYRRLAADDDHDPAKSAQYLSKVKENNVNKMLALSGRPEKVTEQRNVNQILRSLNQLGIRLVPDGHAIEEGTP